MGPSSELESCSLLRDAHVERPSNGRRRVPCACATVFLASLLCILALTWTSREEPRRADATLALLRRGGGGKSGKTGSYLAWKAVEKSTDVALDAAVVYAAMDLDETVTCEFPNIARVSQATGPPREGPILPAGPNMGLVLGLYTYGAPASTRPALKNPRAESGCFPGTRVMTSSVAPESRAMFASTERKHDPITFVGHLDDFEHIWQDTLDVQLDQRGSPVKSTCSATEARRPAQSRSILPLLHKSATYELGLDRSAVDDGAPEGLHMERLFSHFAHMVYSNDSAAVSMAARDLGWNTVGLAKVDTTEGPAPVVYLFQKPDDLVCALVFKGRASIVDYMSEGGCSPVDFCGFADPNDEGPIGIFMPRDGHALVHEGFRDDLLLAVRSGDYTATVYPKLSFCKGVHLVGHSLGGAEAEYFAACASRHLEKGDYGYNDYKFIA